MHKVISLCQISPFFFLFFFSIFSLSSLFLLSSSSQIYHPLVISTSHLQYLVKVFASLVDCCWIIVRNIEDGCLLIFEDYLSLDNNGRNLDFVVGKDNVATARAGVNGPRITDSVRKALLRKAWPDFWFFWICLYINLYVYTCVHEPQRLVNTSLIWILMKLFKKKYNY